MNNSNRSSVNNNNINTGSHCLHLMDTALASTDAADVTTAPLPAPNANNSSLTSSLIDFNGSTSELPFPYYETYPYNDHNDSNNLPASLSFSSSSSSSGRGAGGLQCCPSSSSETSTTLTSEGQKLEPLTPIQKALVNSTGTSTGEPELHRSLVEYCCIGEKTVHPLDLLEATGANYHNPPPLNQHSHQHQPPLGPNQNHHPHHSSLYLHQPASTPHLRPLNLPSIYYESTLGLLATTELTDNIIHNDFHVDSSESIASTSSAPETSAILIPPSPRQPTNHSSLWPFSSVTTIYNSSSSSLPSSSSSSSSTSCSTSSPESRSTTMLPLHRHHPHDSDRPRSYPFSYSETPLSPDTPNDYPSMMIQPGFMQPSSVESFDYHPFNHSQANLLSVSTPSDQPPPLTVITSTSAMALATPTETETPPPTITGDEKSTALAISTIPCTGDLYYRPFGDTSSASSSCSSSTSSLVSISSSSCSSPSPSPSLPSTCITERDYSFPIVEGDLSSSQSTASPSSSRSSTPRKRSVEQRNRNRYNNQYYHRNKSTKKESLDKLMREDVRLETENSMLKEQIRIMEHQFQILQTKITNILTEAGKKTVQFN